MDPVRAFMSDATLNVLLIDDDADTYRLIDALVSQARIAISLVWAPTYDGGLAALARGGHDVGLVDYRLGAANGIELIRIALSLGCSIPLIVLTGAADRDIDVEAMRSGASDYISKQDLDGPLLERALRYAVERVSTIGALRASEANYRLLMDHAADGIVVADSEGRHLAVNSRLCDLLDFSREELLQLSQTDLVVPDDRRLAPPDEGGGVCPPALIERLYRRKDGSFMPVEVGTATMPDGRVQAIVRDISARKRSEQVLRDREQQFRAVFESATDGMVILDDKGCCLDVNEAACATLGAARDALLGRRFADLSPPEMRQKIEERWLGAARDDRFRGECDWPRDSGPSRFIEYSGRVHFLPGRHLIVIRDITERTQLEQRAAAGHKLETVGRLAGGIAHDFNNLLTAIIGYAELAARRSDRAAAAASRSPGDLASGGAGGGAHPAAAGVQPRADAQPRRVDLNAVVARRRSDAAAADRRGHRAGRPRARPGVARSRPIPARSSRSS